MSLVRGFRYRPRRINFRRARRVVRAVSGITLTKRIVTFHQTIPDVTSSDFDNPLTTDLIECTEAQDEEVESDTAGNIADCPLYSRLVGMRLQSIVEGSQTQSNTIRWLIYKKPDGEALVTNLAAQFHSNDDTPTLREIRKYTIAKGQFVVNPSTAVATRNFFVKRKAWKRIAPMRENDKLTLLVAKDAVGTTMTQSLLGQIYVRANA